jgi:hypothetical protein
LDERFHISFSFGILFIHEPPLREFQWKRVMQLPTPPKKSISSSQRKMTENAAADKLLGSGESSRTCC